LKHYCSDCQIDKESSEFYSRGDGLGSNRKVQNICKKCVVARNRVRRLENPGKHKSYDLVRHFGITIDVYNKMLIDQGFCCKICGTHQSKLTRSLHVDHCHATGSIRGLLCSCCNTALGKFRDDVSILEAAINYLKTDLAAKPRVPSISLVKNGGYSNS
jgi:hypothetical protein